NALKKSSCPLVQAAAVMLFTFRATRVPFCAALRLGAFPPAPTDPAESLHKRIDYVWLAGLDPTDARVLDSLASDHRMVVVEAR
ncbi:MAG: hypothetical protein KAX80_14315, partial [Planctomycetes bacterium]|nr:hypothetical protein [Planctomycetota bacterium]